MKNLVFLIALFALVGCEHEDHAHEHAEETIDMDAMKATIQGMEDAFAVAYNARDAEGVVAYYADDAVSMPSEEKSLIGKAAILARTKADMEDDAEGTQRYEIDQLWASGDFAVEAGRSFTTTSAGETETGKYVSIFEKRDGQWICVRDIYNSNTEDDDDDVEEVDE